MPPGSPVTFPKLTLLDGSPASLLYTKLSSPSSFPDPTHLLVISQSKQETTRVQNTSTSVCGCPHLGCSHSCRPYLVGRLSVSIKGSFSLLCVQPQHPGVNLESSLCHIIYPQCRNPFKASPFSLGRTSSTCPSAVTSTDASVVSATTISSWMTVVAFH